jgi:hypothetical protein
VSLIAKRRDAAPTVDGKAAGRRFYGQFVALDVEWLVPE